MIISKINENELEELIEIQKKSFPPELCESIAVFQNRFSHFPQYFRCAKDHDRICAYMIAFPYKLGDIPVNNVPFELPLPQEDSLFIHDITVDPSFRGRGIPRLFLKDAEEISRDSGFRYISLVAIGQSQDYWDKLGFREFKSNNELIIKKLKKSYDDKSRIMFKEL